MNRRWRRSAAVIATTLAALAGGPALGQDLPRESLNDILEPIRVAREVPALAAAIVRGEAITAFGVTGVRELNSAVAATPSDLFHLGSCTKAMTATMIATLVEDGTLSWTTTLAEGFPEFAPRMHAAYRDVTLAQLLAHRGGFPASIGRSRPDWWRRFWTLEEDPAELRREFIGDLTQRPPAQTPGSYVYSNAGYLAAAAMAEAATGTSYDDLMRERLFRPLGMTTADFGAPGDPRRLDQPRGHRVGDEGLAPVPLGLFADNPAALSPAGRVHCSIEDWGRFVALHLAAARGTPALLKPETFAVLHRSLGPRPKGDGGYGLGWVVTERKWAGGRALNHTGSNRMWYAVMWIAPERDFAIIVAANRGDQVGFRACDEAVVRLVRKIATDAGRETPAVAPLEDPAVAPATGSGG